MTAWHALTALRVLQDEIQNFLAQASSSDEEAIDVGAETDHAQPTRKRKTGLATGCTLSPEMQEFLGVDQDARMSRAEVVKVSITHEPPNIGILRNGMFSFSKCTLV